MEPWEDSLNRALKTLAVWKAHAPAQQIGNTGVVEFSALIDAFEPLAQARTAEQYERDAAERDVEGVLFRMKVLGTKVPKIIEGHLDENPRLMKDVNALYRVNPRSEPTILKRARELVPVWELANTEMAALTPPQDPITRSIGGVAHTLAMLQALVDGYADLIKSLQKKESDLHAAHENLRAHGRTVDHLSKRWYKVVKESHDAGDPVYEALAGIPTEPNTPAPDPIEIQTVAQGGENGLQVLVQYVPGGGDHATTKVVQWEVAGVDPEGSFPNTAPLDASGNALGPFAVDQTVKVRTAVRNSSGTRTTAPRTIVVATAIV